MKQFRSALMMILLAGSSALAAATAGRLELQVKHGLWVFSDTSTVTGDTVFPETMLARTGPGDRAQRLADIRGMLSQPTRERECLTQASLEQRAFTAGKTCKQTIVSNTPRSFEAVTECHDQIGAFSQETSKRLVISSPTSATLSMHSVSKQAGKTMTVDSVESGHLVSSDCGDVHTIEQLP